MMGHGWRSASDDPPVIHQNVLIGHNNGVVEIGYKDLGGWWQIGTRRIRNVVRWQPLPKVTNADELVAEADWEFDGQGYAHCSKCGHVQEKPEHTTPYCPECGRYIGL